MAEKYLYKSLVNYNNQIHNTYSDNWGSLLDFLNGKDSDLLTKNMDAYKNRKQECIKL